MQYGHFDDEKREYVIDRVDLPTSWTNYLGVEDMAAVVNHTAGGYLFYKTPEYHRISRFRGNSVPMDRPGFYVYLRDNENADYWSISWQPVGKPLDQAKYTCRHGLSYSVYACDYAGIHAEQTLFIPRGEAVQLWDVRLKNDSDKPRDLSVFSYLEFSFHHVMIDNINFQMSLYAAGSSYADGVIEEDLFYEEEGYQFFTADFEPDGFDCMRDRFLGTYHTETDPVAVANGKCSGSYEKGGNHCGSLQKNLQLAPGEEVRMIFMLGEGRRAEGIRIRNKYTDHKSVDAAFADLAAYWDEKCRKLQIATPNQGMNSLINTWTLYQSEINVMFSRFASFIEVGGRVGLGYRDTAQDSMTVPHSNPEMCRIRIEQLLRGLTSKGYGLHLFQPEWFQPDTGKKPFKSPTVIPKPEGDSIIHGLDDACSDDALWLVPSIAEYVRETGDLSFVAKQLPYADTFVAGSDATASVYEHMKRILDFSAEQVGASGVCKGLRADWNDCLNLGGGESALVTFLHYWALSHFADLADELAMCAKKGCLPAGFAGTDPETFANDAIHYREMMEHLKKVADGKLWDGQWYLRGFTASGRKIGCKEDKEGRVHLESNAWAILSGAADPEKAAKTLQTIDEYLYTEYGLLLNTPSYTVPDDEIGFVTRVYPGLKENGAIFSHPNPWAQAAACVTGRGDLAMKFYDALCPYNQNDKIEIRESEPYSYCQFIAGKDHTAFGRARHPFMTGSGGWSYFTATRYILGIRPQFDSLLVDPCIPAEWDGFEASRVFRGATYRIRVSNPDHVMKGVAKIVVDGTECEKIPVFEKGTEHTVELIMG
ncbi:MAG: N,N'-diacetylchitobiose phosphorylase [Lachnospiraceae bacterium]|nr:N,N'-diacetylchitobiose phosphorylase [Lachnospiraceae bacterium]